MKFISTPVALISAALTWRWSGQKRLGPGVIPAANETSRARWPGRAEALRPKPPTGGQAVGCAAAASRLAVLEAALQQRDREIAALKACLAGGGGLVDPNATVTPWSRGDLPSAGVDRAAADPLPDLAVAVSVEGETASTGATAADGEASTSSPSDPTQGSTSSAGDPFEDSMDAARRVLVLLQDMGAFTLESVAEHVWQWPSDSSTALPQVDVTALTGLLRAIYESLRKADAEMPPEVLARLSDVQLAARAAAGKLQANLRAAFEEGAGRLEAQLPPEVLAHCRHALSMLKEAGDRAAVVADNLATEIASAAATIQRNSHAWLQAFLLRHPEHQASLRNRDPLLVAAAVLPTACFMAWRLLSLARAVLSLLRRPLALVRLALWVLCAPLGCCLRRRRRTGPPPRAEEAAAPRPRQHSDDTDGLSPASLVKGQRKSSLRLAPAGVRVARRGGA